MIFTLQKPKRRPFRRDIIFLIYRGYNLATATKHAAITAKFLRGMGAAK